MQLANPTNFSEKNAVDLKSFDVDFAVTSLFSGKKYRVEFVEVNGVIVHVDVPKAANFLQIAENATGGGDDGEAAEETADVEVPEDQKIEAPQAESPEAQTEDAQEEKESKGVQIDRITLKDVTVKYGLPVKIPMDLELDGIGADSEYGTAFMDVWIAVRDKVMSVVTSVGGAVGDLGKSAAGALKDAGGATVDALKDAHGATVDALKDAHGAATDALKDAGKGIKNLFK
jgi:hypothetical protein